MQTQAILYSATGNLLWVMAVPGLEEEKLTEYAELATTLCQAGAADGLMLLNPETLRLWMLNPDGSNGGFCGNGVRAVAFYLQETRGLHRATLLMAKHIFTVDMQGEQVTITFDSPKVIIQKNTVGYGLDVGNPHVVIVNPPGGWTMAKEGAKFCKEWQANIEFVSLTAEGAEVLVYERGAGVTQACGSGAIATFKVLQALQKINEHLVVTMPGGDLTLSEEAGRLSLSGSVKRLRCN